MEIPFDFSEFVLPNLTARAVFPAGLNCLMKSKDKSIFSCLQLRRIQDFRSEGGGHGRKGNIIQARGGGTTTCRILASLVEEGWGGKQYFREGRCGHFRGHCGEEVGPWVRLWAAASPGSSSVQTKYALITCYGCVFFHHSYKLSAFGHRRNFFGPVCKQRTIWASK